MTSSPELIHELRASRPSAPAELRARVRELVAEQPARRTWRWQVPVRRTVLVAVPAAVALAFASAGVLGLARSDGAQQTVGLARDQAEKTTLAEPAPSAVPNAGSTDQGQPAAGDRAQRVSATLTVEVSDAEAVSRAAQQTLDLTQSLGGFVVSSSVATGEEGSASIIVRVPVDRVQEAIAGLSGLGRIVSQQVTIDDLQQDIDTSLRQARSLRSQIALVKARLDSESLDAETRARLEARLQNLRTDLLVARRNLGTFRAEASMSTIQLAIVTPGALGAAVPPSRIDRTIDEALNILAWEAVVALGILIVLAPFALVGLAAWLGRRLYRRHEEERLLAT
jgi:hypothetical protein